MRIVVLVGTSQGIDAALTRKMRLELFVDLLGDAVPRRGVDHRLIAELLVQFFKWRPRNACSVLAQCVHDERLRERAVPGERHEVREAFNTYREHRNQVETRKRREPGFEVAYCVSNAG